MIDLPTARRTTIDGDLMSANFTLKSEYWTKAECANELGKDPRTLDRWFTLRIGPPRTKCGRTVLFRKSAVAEWLERQTEETVSA